MTNQVPNCLQCGFVFDANYNTAKFCPACGKSIAHQHDIVEVKQGDVGTKVSDTETSDFGSLPPMVELTTSVPTRHDVSNSNSSIKGGHHAQQDVASTSKPTHRPPSGNPSQRLTIVGLALGMGFFLLTTIGVLAWVMLSPEDNGPVTQGESSRNSTIDDSEKTESTPLGRHDEVGLESSREPEKVGPQSEANPIIDKPKTNADFDGKRKPVDPRMAFNPVDASIGADASPVLKRNASVVKKVSRGQLIASIKDATVYIQVEGTKGSGSGSGFVFRRDGNLGHVVTNAHVVTSDEDKITKVVCVFRSGLPEQTKHEAKIIYVDQEADLAILSVDAEDLPNPIDTTMPEETYETLSVMIAGFPFGEMMNLNQDRLEITIGQGSISSMRKDDRGRIRVLQIDGDINPGNSGGPVLDQKGRLVGIANATLTGTNIGFAIPRRFLDDMTRGDVSSVAVVPEGSTTESLKYKVEANIVDPLARIMNVTIYVFQEADADRIPNIGFPWMLATRVPLVEQKFGMTMRTRDEVKLLTSFEVPITESGIAEKLQYQIKIRYKDGTESFHSPSSIASTQQSGFTILQPTRQQEFGPDIDLLTTHLSRALTIKLPTKLADFALDYDTGDLFGTDFENGRVSAFSGKDLRFGRPGKVKQTDVGGHPIGIILKPIGGKKILVVRSHEAPTLLLLDSETMQVQHTVTTESDAITKLTGSRDPSDPFVFYVGKSRGINYLGAIDVRGAKDLGNLGYHLLDATITTDGRGIAIAENRPQQSVSYLRREGEFTDDRPTFSRVIGRLATGVHLRQIGDSDLFQLYDGLWGDQFRERVAKVSNLRSLSIAATDDGQHFFAMTGSRTVQSVANRLHITRRDNTEHSPTLLLPKEFGRQNHRLSFKENNRMRYINFDLKTRGMIQKERHELICCNSDFVLRIPLEALGFPRDYQTPLRLTKHRFEAIAGRELVFALSCHDASATIAARHLPESATSEQKSDGSTQIHWQPNVDQIGTHSFDVSLQSGKRSHDTQVIIQVRAPSLALPVNSAGFSLDEDGSYVITWSGPMIDNSDESSITRSLQFAQPSIIHKLPLRRDQKASVKRLEFPAFAIAMTSGRLFVVSARNRSQIVVLSAETLEKVKSILTASAIEGIVAENGRLLVATNNATEVYDAQTLKIERSSTHAQRPANMPANHTLVDGVIRDGVLYDRDDDRRKLIVSLGRTPSMSVGRMSRLNGSFLRTHSLDSRIPNLQRMMEKESISFVTSTLPIAGSDQSVAVRLKLSKPKNRPSSDTSKMQVQLETLVVNRHGDILSTHRLTDEPLQDEVFIHPPTMRMAGSYFFINFGHRLFRWKPTLDKQKNSNTNSKVDLYFVPEQDTFIVDRKTTVLKHELQGGSGNYSLFLMSRLNGVSLDEETATVRIDREEVVEQAVGLFRSLLRRPTTISDFNVRFREAQANHEKEFELLTGRKLKGFPVGIPIHLKASDPNGQITEIQYFVICDIRSQEVARRVIGLQ